MKIDVALDKSEVELAVRQYINAANVAKGYVVKTLKLLEDGTATASLEIQRQYSGCGKD